MGNKVPKNYRKHRVANRYKPNCFFPPTTGIFFCQVKFIGILLHNLIAEWYVTIQENLVCIFPHRHFLAVNSPVIQPICKLCYFLGHSTIILQERFIHIRCFKSDVARSSVELNYAFSNIKQ